MTLPRSAVVQAATARPLRGSGLTCPLPREDAICLRERLPRRLALLCFAGPGDHQFKPILLGRESIAQPAARPVPVDTNERTEIPQFLLGRAV